MEFTANTLLLPALIQAVARTVDVSPYAELAAAINPHKLNFIKQTNEVRQSAKIKLQIVFSDHFQNCPILHLFGLHFDHSIRAVKLKAFFYAITSAATKLQDKLLSSLVYTRQFFVLLNYIIKYVHTIKSILATSVGLQG